jgi:hypothetical protein
MTAAKKSNFIRIKKLQRKMMKMLTNSVNGYHIIKKFVKFNQFQMFHRIKFKNMIIMIIIIFFKIKKNSIKWKMLKIKIKKIKLGIMVYKKMNLSLLNMNKKIIHVHL